MSSETEPRALARVRRGPAEIQPPDTCGASRRRLISACGRNHAVQVILTDRRALADCVRTNKQKLFYYVRLGSDDSRQSKQMPK